MLLNASLETRAHARLMRGSICTLEGAPTEAKPGGSATPGSLVFSAGGDSSWATQVGTPDFVEDIV